MRVLFAFTALLGVLLFGFSLTLLVGSSLVTKGLGVAGIFGGIMLAVGSAQQYQVASLKSTFNTFNRMSGSRFPNLFG